MNDLSPAATLIASNYNAPIDLALFKAQANDVLDEVEREYGWMYSTKHTDGIHTGVINFTLWSDVFSCPECTSEIVFWNEAIDAQKGGVKDEFECPSCQIMLTKRKLEKLWVSEYDPYIQTDVRHPKQTPVLINYSVTGMSGRFEKVPGLPEVRF